METYDPYKYINEHERQNPNDSLKKLRRDRGKIEEIVGQLTFCLEKLGGTAENLYGLLAADGRIAPQISGIADLIMGKQRLMPVDPLEIVTKTGKSDLVRSAAVADIPEKDLPVHLCIHNMEFCSPRARVAIVGRLNDHAVLKEIALKGGRDDGEFAATKLTSLDDLYDVAMGANYQSTALVAVENLSDEYLERLVERCQNNYVRCVAVMRMSDQQKLQDLYAGLQDLVGIDAGVTTLSDTIRGRMKALSTAKKNPA